MPTPAKLSALTVAAALAASAAAAADAPYAATYAETRHVDAEGIRYAYRTFGPAEGVPLVLVNRLRGTMNEWDPLLIELVAARRPVVIFDNVGLAETSGPAPITLKGFAAGAARFIRALGHRQVDLMGFSFGGLTAQQLVLDEPGLVRKLVIVGSGAGFVEGAPLDAEMLRIAARPVNTDEDFLTLFFEPTPSSQRAGREHLARLKLRPGAYDVRVSEAGWRAQLAAASDVGTAVTSLLTRAHEITKPVLVANGNHDAMIPTYQSFALAQAIPNAKLILYPDSGHAFMFQHARAFAEDMERFLAE
ncbi:MAG: alpha/beta fold hydrolase [Alphaproteobacteria bacterium]